MNGTRSQDSILRACGTYPVYLLQVVRFKRSKPGRAKRLIRIVVAFNVRQEFLSGLRKVLWDQFIICSKRVGHRLECPRSCYTKCNYRSLQESDEFLFLRHVIILSRATPPPAKRIVQREPQANLPEVASIGETFVLREDVNLSANLRGGHEGISAVATLRLFELGPVLRSAFANSVELVVTNKVGVGRFIQLPNRIEVSIEQNTPTAGALHPSRDEQTPPSQKTAKTERTPQATCLERVPCYRLWHTPTRQMIF